MSVVFPAVWGRRATPALVKYAHTATLLRAGLSVQAVVTPVVVAVPFTAVFGDNGIVTAAPLLMVTVRASVSVALMVTVPMFEFAACACEAGTISPIRTRAIETTQNFWNARIDSPKYNLPISLNRASRPN